MARDAQHRGRGRKLWPHGSRGLYRPCTPSNAMAEPVTPGAEMGTAPATTTINSRRAMCLTRDQHGRAEETGITPDLYAWPGRASTGWGDSWAHKGRFAENQMK